jgi:hypothetical protein
LLSSYPRHSAHRSIRIGIQNGSVFKSLNLGRGKNPRHQTLINRWPSMPSARMTMAMIAGDDRWRLQLYGTHH